MLYIALFLEKIVKISERWGSAPRSLVITYTYC